MADFVAVLKKTIDGLSDNTPAMRDKVYRKARDTIAAKLAAIDPPPSRIVVERQHKALADAIKAVEASYTEEESAPIDFESVLAGLGQSADEPPAQSPAPSAEPIFSQMEPANGNGHSDLAVPARTVGPEHEFVETDVPIVGADDAPTDEGLTPIASVKRPEPPLARPSLAGDDAASGRAAARAAGGNRRRVSGGLIAAAIVVIVVAAAGYGIWLNRAEFGAMLGLGGGATVVEAPQEIEAEPETEVAAEPEEPAEQDVAAAAPEPPPAPSSPRADDELVKFTQRLTADGREVDEGPAGGEASIGEGSSLAAATQGGETAPAQPTQSATGEQAAAEQPAEGNQAVPVGQRAIFYEERTNVAQGSADTGSTVWSLVQESPGGDLPPEPAIRAEVTVPAKDMQLRMTIRRNGAFLRKSSGAWALMSSPSIVGQRRSI
jgi:hypothetical protein